MILLLRFSQVHVETTSEAQPPRLLVAVHGWLGFGRPGDEPNFVRYIFTSVCLN